MGPGQNISRGKVGGALQILSEVGSLVQEKEIGQRWEVLETRECCGTNGMPTCVVHPDTHVLGPVIPYWDAVVRRHIVLQKKEAPP